MKSRICPPERFAAHSRGAATLIAEASLIEWLKREHLHDATRWQALLQASPIQGGRGKSARLELAGRSARLKQMRRGGLAGPIWRDRFFGTGRLLDNLRLPLEAVRRGLPTPAPMALLLVEGPPAFYRAWLAVEELDGAQDLIAHFASGRHPSAAELAAVMGLLKRMHELGLEHADLHLGNLLLRRRGSARPEVFVIDLDRAQLHGRPLSFRRSMKDLQRLERSYVKRFGARGEVQEHVRGLLYELYACGDETLTSRLRAVRRSSKLRIAMHRLGGLR